MATNPNYPDHKLTDWEMTSILYRAFPSVSVPGVDNPIPQAIWEAFAICFAESRFVVNAFRPEDQNELGGEDRGIWQWNSLAHADVSDAAAYNPYSATLAAAQKSGNGSDWGPWAYGPNSYRDGVSRTDLDFDGARRKISAALETPLMTRAEVIAFVSSLGFVALGGNVQSPLDRVVDAVVPDNPLAALQQFSGQLGKVLSALGDPDWWRRIGIGVLGALIVTAAIGLLNSGNVQKLAKTATLATPAGKAASVAS
jgi:hypothetical protein